MGKEWYWSGSRSSTSKRGDNNNTTTSTTTPSGCMSAVFHFFDFHHFQFPLNHHHHQHHHQSPFISHHHEDRHHTVLKGVEAPRNSLELEETPSLSSSSNLKQGEEEDEEEVENLKIPMGIQIKTNNNTRSSKSNYDSASSSEISSSSPGGANTPNLVARLMGLDLLPDKTTNSPSNNSSSSSSSFQEPLPTKLNLNHHHLRPTRQALQTLQNKQISLHDVINTSSGSGTRSLPETPRISSARRSDVDYHHRLSLQINKEIIINGGGEEVEFSRFSYLRRREIKEEDEYYRRRRRSSSPRQIVEQVKESVTRKVGLDITNTLRNNRDTTLQSREEIFSQLKTKKNNSRALNKLVVSDNNQSTSPGKHSSTPSCSPRLSRFLEPKHKHVTPPPTTATATATDLKIQAQPIRDNLSPKPKLQQQQQQQQQQSSQSTSQDRRPAKKCKKATAGEQRLIKMPPKTSDVIRNKQEESFVRPSSTGNKRANNADKNYSKKTPLSNGLLINISSVPSSTLLPLKKDIKIPQKKVLLNAQSSKRVSSSSNTQLSSNSSQISYKQEATRTLIARDNNNNIDDRSNGGVATTTTTATSTTTITVSGAEHQEYITRILKRTGLDKHTPVSFTTWFSPSHPLDPSIFHHLENNDNPTSDSGQLSLLCNRKLLFQLVDEILADVLKPVINIKPWCNVIGSICRGCYYYGYMHGSNLIDTLCLVVGSFPCADCRVLEDIDGLIDKDLPKMKLQNEIAWEEEGEGVVTEIEKDILDSLINETAFYFISILL
ncbi:hypothetical protein Ddye_013583 [Dipteronia dyeriana]|uniref:DUF4378 domain-containing protein n=1 Tax=Dipteronia dyeriana TaxID=168575 RepID=A0AAE0CJR1_9ROSI|nr:hypothetical protein Ddye_013583 [Dipteronia dyeriana]